MQPADPGRATGASTGGYSHVAANDDQGPASQIVRERSMTLPLPASSGWDPFEVWRTRVRDARRGATGAEA